MKLWLLDVYLLQITHKELIYQNKQDIITQHTVDKVVEKPIFLKVQYELSDKAPLKKAITSYYSVE